MDPFADRMTGRGPTLARDRETWTGSLHIVDLPDAVAACAFVEQEPYNRAGVFGSHLIRRFENRLDRTMWEFPGESADPRFLVIALIRADPNSRLPPAPRVELPAATREHLIIHGELTEPDGAPAGFVAALQVPTRIAVDAALADEEAGLDERFEVEIHDWEPGGRR